MDLILRRQTIFRNFLNPLSLIDKDSTRSARLIVTYYCFSGMNDLFGNPDSNHKKPLLLLRKNVPVCVSALIARPLLFLRD